MQRNASLHRIAIRRHKSAKVFSSVFSRGSVFGFKIEFRSTILAHELKTTNIKPHEFRLRVRVSTHTHAPELAGD